MEWCILQLQQLPGEWVMLMGVMVCGCAIPLIHHLLGEIGLVLYSTLAVVIANIEVMKGVQLGCYPEPIALGTILFSTTFIVSDILHEHYSKQAALRAIWCGFSGSLLVSLWMVFTLGLAPLDVPVNDPIYGHFREAHEAMMVLFVPAPVLLLASMVSYVLSQWADIWCYAVMLRLCGRKRVWLRSQLSTWMGCIADNIIFSICAWRLFTPHPIDWYSLWHSYILSAVLLRGVVSVLLLPIVYSIRSAKEGVSYAAQTA